jgi:uncharacterized damage-inducible protein DinB
MLNAEQLAAMKAEGTLQDTRPPIGRLVEHMSLVVTRLLDELRTVRGDDLRSPRRVGRAGLPSTVGGLLFHAAEHATRHAGQALTTARIVAAQPEAP